MSGVCVWSLIEFGSGMECHASKNNLRDHKGLTAVYGLNIIKIKFVVVFHTVLRQKRVLVTCEDGAFVFFCSGSQCSGMSDRYSWAAVREFGAGYSEAVSAIGASSGIWAWVSWFRFVFDTLVLSHGDVVLNTDSGTDKEPLHRLQYSLSLYAECDWCVQSAVGDHFSLEFLTSILDIHKVKWEQFPHFDSTIKTLYTPLKNAHNICNTVSCWKIFSESYK